MIVMSFLPLGPQRGESLRPIDTRADCCESNIKRTSAPTTIRSPIGGDEMHKETNNGPQTNSVLNVSADSFHP